MALSVSGFPEPSRYPGTSNEVFTGESPQDGYGKATLMNSPRLRGLFGASNGPNRRPDSKNSTTSSKSDAEPDSSSQSAITATTPPTTPSLSFSSSFEPLSQQEYELELQLPMTIPLNPPRPRASSLKRPQLPPIPRKTTASPVRLGPNLARLEIGGAWARSPPTLHSHPKPLPPSVVVQEWGAKVADVSSSSSANQPAQSRPLPSVPGNNGDPGKHIPNTVTGPPRTLSAAVPVAGPSRHVNAVAGSSKNVNAVAGPSKHPAALPSPPLTSPTAPNAPSSKVLITPQRTHRQNSPSLSMRYQSLVAAAEPSSAPSTDAVGTNSNSNSNSATVSSPVRPLPRIPPAAGGTTPAINANLRTAPPGPAPSRYDPPPPVKAKAKRPRTSPSPIRAPASATLTRSPFDNITSSWATRPVDLNPPISPLPISSGVKPPPPRARSHSRPRRDRSLDSHYSNTRTPFRVSSPAQVPANPNPAGGRPVRSPTIGGARPLPKRSNTLDNLPSTHKGLHIQTSNVALAMGTGSSSGKVFTPPTRRSQPPSPPTGPIKPRTKPSPISSPILPASLPAPRNLPKPQLELPIPPPPVPTHSTPEDETITIATVETQDDPLHSHPLEAFTDSESLLHPPTSPVAAESPIEVFIDDQDLSTVSRSPSPIRYARPDSRGNLSESDDDDDNDTPSSSSVSSSRTGSPNRRRRTQQLRSYRNSYRPRGQNSPPHIPFRPRSPSPIAEQAQTPLEPGTGTGTERKKKKKESRKAKSYFGGTASGSAPATRASSPERKSRSRQPRRLALAEAVTSALEEVRNRGRGGSSSPKRKLKPTGSAPGPSASSAAPGFTSASAPAPVMEEMEVLDISLPSLSRRETTGTLDTASSMSDHNTNTSANAPPATGSARSSAKVVGWAKTIARKRSEPGDHSSTGSGSVAHLSSMVTGVEVDGAETPYMWVSASKPPVTPAPFIPPPPPQPHHHHHRRMDSLGLEDYPLLSGGRQQADVADSEKHGISCGLPIGGTKSRAMETTITSTVSVSRPASSSISTPFSGFSLTGRSSKKKRTTSSSVDDGFTVSVERNPPLAVHKQQQQQQEGVEIGWRDDEKRSVQEARVEEGEVVVVTTRRITRGVDGDGDVWEHEQEAGVADVIPHLRNLKAKKG